MVDHAWAAFDELRPRPDAVTARPAWECECGGLKMFNSDGLPTCRECGRTEFSYISDEPEWRGGADDDGTGGGDPSRVGAPSNLDHFSAAWNTGTIMNAQRAAGIPCQVSATDLNTPEGKLDQQNGRDRRIPRGSA